MWLKLSIYIALTDHELCNKGETINNAYAWLGCVLYIIVKQSMLICLQMKKKPPVPLENNQSLRSNIVSSVKQFI